MGLDIVLGLIVLVGAVRGWFQGFVYQAIRLGSLVGCVYAAGPIRDQVRPEVLPYLKAMPPQVVDRLLWWSSAVVVYLVAVGLSSLAVRAYRKRPIGDPEPNRADEMAGFLLATAKGLVMASFLVAGLERNAMTYVKAVPWAEEQTKASVALTWHDRYHPADQIWAAAPVQQFVAHVKRMGVGISEGTEEKPAASAAVTEPAEPTPPPEAAQNASTRPPRLEMPSLDPNSADFARQLGRALEDLKVPAGRP